MLLHLAALAATILVLSRVVPSVHIRSWGTAILVAIVFSLVNFFLGWAIRMALFVPAILTFGLLFLFVPFIVNVVVLWLTDKLIASFEIRRLGGLLVSAGAITLVEAMFHAQVLQTAVIGHGHPRWI
jgi:putative membrane protein